MSSAAAQPWSTSTNGASSRVMQAVERRVRRAHARREPPRARRDDGSSGAPSAVADHEHQRRRVGGLELRDRGAGGGVAVDDKRVQRLAQRGGDRDLGARLDLDVIGEPADHAVERGRSARRGASSSASASVSARARHRDASAVASRHSASACCTASSAARSARDSSVSSGVIAALRRRPRCAARPRAFDLVGFGAARLDRRVLGVDLGQLGWNLRELARDRLARASLWSISRCASASSVSAARADASRGQLARPELGFVRRRGARPNGARRLGGGRGAAQATRRRDRPRSAVARSRRLGDERLDDSFVGNGRHSRSIARAAPRRGSSSPRLLSRNASVRASRSATSSPPGTADRRVRR